MQSSLMNLVAPFCKKVKNFPKCGNWQKCNYVTAISLYCTMKTPILEGDLKEAGYISLGVQRL
jgi:hypothetical protein